MNKNYRERREHIRVNLDVFQQLSGTVSASRTATSALRCTVVEISLGGAKFFTPGKLAFAKGQTLYLENLCNAEGDCIADELTLEVGWCHERTDLDCTYYGCHIIQLSKETQENLFALLQ